MDYSLWTEDIVNAFDNKIKIINYRELIDYNTIEDVLKPYGKTIVLYEFKPRCGHWTAIFYVYKNKKIDHIELFDSYGLRPGDEIEWVPYTFKKMSKQYRSIILGLLAKSKYPIYFNQHKLQKHGDKIATCGRWCIVRVANNDMDENEFKDKIVKFAKNNNCSLDEAIVLLTKDIIHH